MLGEKNMIYFLLSQKCKHAVHSRNSVNNHFHQDCKQSKLCLKYVNKSTYLRWLMVFERGKVLMSQAYNVLSMVLINQIIPVAWNRTLRPHIIKSSSISCYRSCNDMNVKCLSPTHMFQHMVTIDHSASVDHGTFVR